jgi:formylglycine-generating enzyme required for sulfatase activity
MGNDCHPLIMGSSRELLPMVAIPPGVFPMGGMEDDKFVSEVELPVREVVVEKGFSISAAPVTREQWMEVMGSLPSGNDPGLSDKVPVVCIGFADAQAFCRELGSNCRLPSEAEWEYACRAGSGTVFPHGSDMSTDDANYLYDELGFQVGKGRMMPVGSYGCNGFGLYDMIGNVCEWVADTWHAGYRDAPRGTAPWVAGGKAGCRVIRGGGWDHLPRVLRASWRDWAPESARWDNLGFRVVEDFKETK